MDGHGSGKGGGGHITPKPSKVLGVVIFESQSSFHASSSPNFLFKLISEERRCSGGDAVEQTSGGAANPLD